MRREYLQLLLAAGFAWLGQALIVEPAATTDDSHRGMSRRVERASAVFTHIWPDPAGGLCLESPGGRSLEGPRH